MIAGIALALGAFAVYASGDALIKSAGADGMSSVFAIAFFVTLFSVVPILATKPADERWRDAFNMRHPVACHLRAAAGIGSGLCGFTAYTQLPLAEAYTLLFLIPFFVTLLSILILKEQVGWRRWLAIAVGLAGVLIAIRPGFRALEPAHLAAVGAALCGATTLVIMRAIAPTERRMALLVPGLLYALLVNGALMAATFAMPETITLAKLAGAGLLHGVGTVLIVLASRRVPANRIAPTQYSQLLWGVVFGVLFFAEVPDGFDLIGMALVIAAGLATFMREDALGVWPKRFRFIRRL